MSTVLNICEWIAAILAIGYGLVAIWKGKDL